MQAFHSDDGLEYEYGTQFLSFKVGSAPINIPETQPLSEAESEWTKIVREVSAEVCELGQGFISICKKWRALEKCAVDLLDDGTVLFDWNEGSRPILSVMIGPGQTVTYVGRFRNGGKMSGEDPNLSYVGQPLERMVREWGIQVSAEASQDISWNPISSEEEDLQSSSYHTLTFHSRNGPQVVPQIVTYSTPESMLETNGRRHYMVGA